MIKRNTLISQLKKGYLFPEIHKRKLQFLEKNPEVTLISLGIGDTTEPIPASITTAIKNFALNLSTPNGYSGYGPEQGLKSLREKIATVLYHDQIPASDIFISDGAKCDIGRLQTLFGPQVSIAVQDPSYPVYVDGSLIHGVKKIVYMPCTPENDFFPDLDQIEKTDILYFCSPNNPTGAVATKEQLKKLVAFAKKNQSIIVYDSAYSTFIQDEHLPKSIYEIEGAKEVAIETGSFSKIAGFTGVRLGWTIVPEELKYADGSSVKQDFHRLVSTIFNGASNLAQMGGVAVLEPQGWQDVIALKDYYLDNAKIIKEAFQKKGLEVFGAENAPYVWVRFKGKDSWDTFQYFLEKLHIVCTPGGGFGPSGNEFVRFTAFGHKEKIQEAIKRIEMNL